MGKVMVAPLSVAGKVTVVTLSVENMVVVAQHIIFSWFTLSCCNCCFIKTKS